MWNVDTGGLELWLPPAQFARRRCITLMCVPAQPVRLPVYPIAGRAIDGTMLSSADRRWFRWWMIMITHPLSAYAGQR